MLFDFIATLLLYAAYIAAAAGIANGIEWAYKKISRARNAATKKYTNYSVMQNTGFVKGNFKNV